MSVGNWAAVPDELLRGGQLSSRAVCVYALIARYANKDGVAWPHQSTLARELACSVATIERAVRELRESGWLSVRRKGLTPGIVYTIHKVHKDPLEASQDPASEPSKSRRSQPSRITAPNEREPVEREKEKLATQAPPPKAAVSRRAQAELQAHRDELLDPAACVALLDPPAERGYAALAAAQDGEDRGYRAAMRQRPRVRAIDGESPMGLALAWRRRMQEARIAGALDANLKALARFFRVLLEEGATPRQIRLMATVYAEHEGTRNPAVAPWRDFLYQRHLLLDRARRRDADESARTDPAAAYALPSAERQADEARRYREEYDAYFAAA